MYCIWMRTNACCDVDHRGFRQITRGPDTGAFSHPLFQRDRPELCYEMVCHRASDGKKVSKAKSVKDSASPLQSGDGASNMSTPMSTEYKGTMKTSAGASRCLSIVSNNSEDSQSIESSSTADTISRSLFHSTDSDVPSQMMSPQTLAPSIKLRISNDASFVEACNQRREEMERMHIVKTMLYSSYMKALIGG
jgi:hypothetical protein